MEYHVPLPIVGVYGNTPCPEPRPYFTNNTFQSLQRIYGVVEARFVEFYDLSGMVQFRIDDGMVFIDVIACGPQGEEYLTLGGFRRPSLE